jgi:tRNA U34 5-methylaminomethyl-2-thiouridine-forming methyltransferase MnmC
MRYYDPMKDPKSLPPSHRWVETEDGSKTLFSEQFQEACHSTTGAKAETVLHYVGGCKVVERAYLKEPFVILEVGFGLGVGFLTTMEKIPERARWHFISLEIDRDLLEWFRLTNPELKLHWEGNLLKGNSTSWELTVIQGDARVELLKYLEKQPVKFDAIYQDAFSPKKNPTLWTKEWFELLKVFSDEDVILSTYSASTSIRKSLHETGWGVQRGEKFGPKRTSTRATLKLPTDTEILLQMERSPVSAISDLNIETFLGTIKK